MKCHFLILLLCIGGILQAPAEGAAPPLRSIAIKEVGPAADEKRVELRGVGAGAFEASIWQAGTLNLLPDARSPMLAPREGKFRNIYAPSVVQTKNGWRIYFGGWDGVPTGNDRIYSVETTDFLSFTDRRTVIEHGVFQHVCNVNVVAASEGGAKEDGEKAAWAMVATGYPDARGRNKPVTFFSDDGVHFNDGVHLNSTAGAFSAMQEQIVSIDGYEKYADADINGMNVLLREGDKYRLYFGNFRDFGRTYRASSADGKRFTFDGVALEGAMAVNDVKKFEVGDGDGHLPWYLMGLHMNGDRIFYALSRDGMTFEPARTLVEHVGPADRYMVAVGWVTDDRAIDAKQDVGAPGQPGRRSSGRRLLGVLYGAGAKGSLDQNRIFARWLQKKVTFTANGKAADEETVDEKSIEAKESLGPDAQLLALNEKRTGQKQAGEKQTGRLDLYAEDGKTLLATLENVELTPGRAYEISLSAK